MKMKMKMKMKKTILTVMVMSAAVSVLFAGLTSGKEKMSGLVTDKETGKPLEGVTVKLFYPGVEAYHKPFPTTDKEGKWRVLYIRRGRWNLDFVKDGYAVQKISFNVGAGAGEKRPLIRVEMVKAEGPTVAHEIVKQIETARGLMSEKKYPEALQALIQTREKHKDGEGIEIVNLYIGNCYAAQGDYLQAIEYYKKSLEKFPRHEDLILSIGNAYNNLNNHDEAMKWFGKLTIEDIDNVDTLYNIGVMAYNKADYPTAMKYFQRAAEVKTDFAEAHYQLGMTYTALNKQKEAVSAFKKFMELAPDSPNFETAKAIVEAFGDGQ